MSIEEQMHELLQDYNPELILWSGFEAALVGIADRCGQPALAVYDYDKMVALLVRRDGMSDEEAREFIDFNVTGGWLGENTPVCLYRMPELEELRRKAARR